VEGKKIASEAQRQLYDDIKRGQCTRCHKGGHVRRDCKEPQEKWEEKFDKEKEKYWESVAKWPSRATTSSITPPTLHAKPAVKFTSLKSIDKPEHRASSIMSDTDNDDHSSYPPLHYRMTIDDDPEDDDTQNDDTMDDPQDDTDPQDDDTYSFHFVSTSVAPTPAALAAIFTHVNSQLNTLPLPDAHAIADDANLVDDERALARMDAHVRAILASADPMLYALNTTLGHKIPRTSPPPLTDETMAAAIAEMHAYYYADTSSSEDDSLFPYTGRPPLSVAVPLADPPRTQPSQLALKHTPMQDILDRRSPRTQPYVTTSTPHSDLDIRFEVIPQAMEGSETTPYEPPDNRETMLGSSSIETLLPTLRPRASWMIDDGTNALMPKLMPIGTEPTNGSVPPRHHHSVTATTTAYPGRRSSPPSNGFRRPSLSPHTRMRSLWRSDRSRPPTLPPPSHPGNHSNGTHKTNHMALTPNLQLGGQGAAHALPRPHPATPSQTRTCICNPTLGDRARARRFLKIRRGRAYYPKTTRGQCPRI
jgi:hypothetical protein